MSDAIIGVIIGGLIGSAIPLTTLWFSEKRARQEKIIDHLKNKRTELIKEFTEIKTLLLTGLSQNNYSIDMISKLECILPQNVYKAFDEMMVDKTKNNDPVKKKFHYRNILNEMHKAIANIDVQIEEEIQK